MLILLTVFKFILLGLAVAGVVGLIFAAIYRDNRLFFWCLLGALGSHAGFAGSLWLISHFTPKDEGERKIAVTFVRTPAPPVKKIPEPKEVERKLDIPFGSPKGQKNVTKIKKGSTTNPNARMGAKGQKTYGNRNVMASPTDSGAGDVEYDPDAKGPILGPGDSLDIKDLNNVGKIGGGGDDWGIKDGDPNGGMPKGFAQGKIGGKVYFIRLKHGTGAWFAYDDGTKRLLTFLNKSEGFPCQTETWPMTTDELKRKYMSKGGIPSFIYIYCDDTFALTGGDVAVLREYLQRGGFLFLDSRPDLMTKERVEREINKVLPNSRMAALPRTHAIYTFLYRLPGEVTGLNLVTNKNYGVTRDGRLIVFYCMGNLSNLYSLMPPDDGDAKGSYQLGLNVMLYAITKGDASGFTKKQGAKTVISTQMLEKLGMITSSAAKPPPAPVPGETIKIKREPPPTTDGNPPTESDDPEPDDIKVLDD